MKPQGSQFKDARYTLKPLSPHNYWSFKDVLHAKEVLPRVCIQKLIKPPNHTSLQTSTSSELSWLS